MRSTLSCLALAWRSGRVLAAGLAVLAVAAGTAPLVTAWLTKSLVDSVVHLRDPSVALVAGLALAGTGIAAGLLAPSQQYVQQRLERRVGRLAQSRLYRATERFVGLARFEDPVFADKLRLAQQHGGATPSMVVTSLLSIGRSVLTIVGFVAILARLAPWLPVMVMASALPAMALELRQARRRIGTTWQLGPVQRREFFFRGLLSDVQAAKEIRLLGLGGYFRERMQRERLRADTASDRLDGAEFRLKAAMSALAGVTGALALVWAAPAAVHGRITVGDITIVVSSLAAMQGGVLSLVRDVGVCRTQVALFGHYLDIVRMEPDLPTAADPPPLPPLRHGIEFRDVWFRYGPEHPWVLRNVSFTIPAGRSVGLVGRNGAGKSTIVKLLLRMYDPTRGCIRWDGVDLRDVRPADLRAAVGAVFQDFMCYDLTARENIQLGDLAADRDVEVAAARSGAAAFLRALPRGYDTLLSRIFVPGDSDEAELGVVLSGGQWQRLALARAYQRIDRDLLVLDEPSSGLDAEAEYEIHTGLREHRAGRTCLLISHRLGTMRDADLLLVLAGGTVVESGSHQELMTTPDGCYARLFRMQASGYVDRTVPAAG